MFKGVRIVATTILLAAIVMTFVSAFVLPTVLCIIFVIVRARPLLYRLLLVPSRAPGLWGEAVAGPRVASLDRAALGLHQSTEGKRR